MSILPKFSEFSWESSCVKKILDKFVGESYTKLISLTKFRPAKPEMTRKTNRISRKFRGRPNLVAQGGIRPAHQE